MLYLRLPLLTVLAAALASACIPPELTAAQGAGGSGAGGGGTGASGATGGVVVTGGDTGTVDPLCDDVPCQAAGGTCVTGVCVIDCGVTQCASGVTCPADMPCRIECNAADECQGGLDCTLASSCDIACNAPGTCGGQSAVALISCPMTGCNVDCAADACTWLGISCLGSCDVTCVDGACDNLKCSGDCDITCGGDNACAYVECDLGLCVIDCPSTGSCAAISCAGQGCEIDCAGDGSCQSVDCSLGCGCNVDCFGPMACPQGSMCPSDDMMGSGPCSLDAGCTSVGACQCP